MSASCWYHSGGKCTPYLLWCLEAQEESNRPSITCQIAPLVEHTPRHETIRLLHQRPGSSQARLAVATAAAASSSAARLAHAQHDLSHRLIPFRMEVHPILAVVP